MAATYVLVLTPVRELAVQVRGKLLPSLLGCQLSPGPASCCAPARLQSQVA